MRSLAALACLSLLSLAGCAGTATQDRVVVAVDAPARSSSDEVQITESIPQAAQEPAVPVRRRLSQTVTLGQGQGAADGYSPAPPPPGAPNGQGGPNVIVNNNVTVVNQPPVIYGGYGGYSYGYGTAAAGYGARGAATYGEGRGGSAGAPSHQAWAPSGWEGAGRTAAPGATPRVGGNFSPPQSSGPAPMR